MQPPEPLERRSARRKARFYGLERLQRASPVDSGSCAPPSGPWLPFDPSSSVPSATASGRRSNFGAWLGRITTNRTRTLQTTNQKVGSQRHPHASSNLLAEAADVVNRHRLMPTATKTAPATGVKFSAVTGAPWSQLPAPSDLKSATLRPAFQPRTGSWALNRSRVESL